MAATFSILAVDTISREPLYTVLRGASRCDAAKRLSHMSIEGVDLIIIPEKGVTLPSEIDRSESLELAFA